MWHSEDGFRANEQRFVDLVAPYAPEGIDVKAALTATERKNLSTFGYGVKSFGLSMVEAAVTISGGKVPSTVVAETGRDGPGTARGAGAAAGPRARGARRGRRDATGWS